MTVAEPRPNAPLDPHVRWQEGVVSISHHPRPPVSETKDTIPLPGRAAGSALAFSRETEASDIFLPPTLRQTRVSGSHMSKPWPLLLRG